jgi:hypothetical protein
VPLPVLVGSGIKAPSLRWPEVEARARPVAEAELRSAGEALARAMVATAVLDAEGGLFALVLRRDATAASLTLSVGTCRVDVQGVPWVEFDESAALDLTSRRLFNYLGRSKLDDPLMMAQLKLEGCPSKPGDVVKLGEHGTPFEQAVVGRVTRTLQATRPMVALPAAAVAEGRSDEASWRRRYAEAHKHIADVEREIEEERRFIQQSDRRGNDPRMPWRLAPAEIERYDAAKAKLARADELRAQARAALDELDRQAANAAVPLEWRR